MSARYSTAGRYQVTQAAATLLGVPGPSHGRAADRRRRAGHHDRLPHSRVDFIDNAGHFCWEEKPDEYAALVTEWWNEPRSA
jgi:pimeloyl-ACP methyl ester carboxylesterase